MIVAYSSHCMGPMAVPPHHQTCSAPQYKTKPPACPHGVGGCSPRCRIAWNGLHHPRESISAPIDVLEIWTYGGLGMEKRLKLQPDCFERQRKVAQSARWGYATAPNDPSRVFPRNGFEDIVCGIHPRELLRIEILPILILVSLLSIVFE